MQQDAVPTATGPVYFLMTSVFNQRLVSRSEDNPLFAQNAAAATYRLAARPKSYTTVTRLSTDFDLGFQPFPGSGIRG